MGRPDGHTSLHSLAPRHLARSLHACQFTLCCTPAHPPLPCPLLRPSLTWLMVGWTQPVRMPWMVAIASMPPAA